VAYEWHFPGATPDVSNDANPVVIYPAPGNFDVMLILNKGGEIDTLTKTSLFMLITALVLRNRQETSLLFLLTQATELSNFHIM